MCGVALTVPEFKERRLNRKPIPEREIRNPKTEARGKSECRMPNVEFGYRLLALGYSSLRTSDSFGFRSRAETALFQARFRWFPWRSLSEGVAQKVYSAVPRILNLQAAEALRVVNRGWRLLSRSPNQNLKTEARPPKKSTNP
jgi:hypothetical protein